MSTTYANPEVLAFYRALPFNTRESVEQHIAAIKATNPVLLYPGLPGLLRPGVSVLEVGCGTGWFSHAMCFRYRASVVGIDFNELAIERARAVAAAARLDVSFSVEDLFLYDPGKPFDVVVSIGVLHHTNDCIAAVTHICEKLVKPGGSVLIGLYHKHGRKPFLEHFQGLKDRGASEAELLEAYRALHPTNDETHLVSWFRDQVLHPHETQHTLQELHPVLKATGMELVGTSINNFGPIASMEELYERECALEAVGQDRLQAGKYYSGFFVFQAKKPAV